MIIGIDIGGTTTDAVRLGGKIHAVSVETSDPVAAAAGALARLLGDLGCRLPDIDLIAATGGGAGALGDELLGVPVRKVPEITAIAVGGATLAEREEALVVSMGTGTAMVAIRGDEIVHAGGTGVGGGTLRGLAKHLLNASRLETVERLAQKGDRTRVDLMVADIAGGPVGEVPATATASNFGKLSDDVTAEDKACALINLIAEVILVLSVSAARTHGLRDIVLTGKLVRVKRLVERITSAQSFFERNFIVPSSAAFATAIGAVRSVSR